MSDLRGERDRWDAIDEAWYRAHGEAAEARIAQENRRANLAADRQDRLQFFIEHDEAIDPLLERFGHRADEF